MTSKSVGYIGFLNAFKRKISNSRIIRRKMYSTYNPINTIPTVKHTSGSRMILDFFFHLEISLNAGEGFAFIYKITSTI